MVFFLVTEGCLIWVKIVKIPPKIWKTAKGDQPLLCSPIKHAFSTNCKTERALYLNFIII